MSFQSLFEKKITILYEAEKNSADETLYDHEQYLRKHGYRKALRDILDIITETAREMNGGQSDNQSVI